MENTKNFIYNKIIVPVIQFLHLLVTKYLTWTLLGIAGLIILLVLIIILLTRKERNAYRLAQYQYRYNAVDSLSQEEVQNIAHNVPDKDMLYKNLSESKEEAQKQMELNDPQYTYNQQKKIRLENKQKKKEAKKQTSKDENKNIVQDSSQDSKEKTKPTIKETIKKIISIVEPQQTKEEPVVVEQKPVTETKTTYTGKWKIYTLEDGRLYATLTASNGGILLKTEPYSSITSMRNGIETIKKYVENDNFIIFVDKEGRYRFKVITKQNKLICSSEKYSTKAKCDGGIQSVKRFINSAQIIRID